MLNIEAPTRRFHRNLRRVRRAHPNLDPIGQQLSDFSCAKLTISFSGCAVLSTTPYGDDALISQSAVDEETTTADANLDSRPSSRPLIASAWHTIVFITIFVGISVVGGFFQHAVKQHPQATVSGNAVSRYISVLVFEWLLVLYVRRGCTSAGCACAISLVADGLRCKR